jgi:glucose-1-phosphate adenylyltransferase
VCIEEGAVVEDSILFFDTVVGREAHVSRTIADVETRIGSGARVGSRDGELSVIGQGSTVPDEVRIQQGVTVYPNVEASHFSRKEYRRGEIVK